MGCLCRLAVVLLLLLKVALLRELMLALVLLLLRVRHQLPAGPSLSYAVVFV